MHRSTLERSASLAAAAAIVALAAPFASAQDAAPAAAPEGLKWSVSFGVTTGGDKLAGYDVTSNFGERTESIRAGGGVDYRAGLDYRFAASWAVQTSIGYHSDRVAAENGSASFRRYPLDLTGSFQVPVAPVRFGVGARKPLSPRFKESGDAGNKYIKFSSSVSPLVYIEYVSSSYGVKLQGSLSQTYTVSGFTGSLKGNHVGVFGSLYF